TVGRRSASVFRHSTIVWRIALGANPPYRLTGGVRKNSAKIRKNLRTISNFSGTGGQRLRAGANMIATSKALDVAGVHQHAIEAPRLGALAAIVEHAAAAEH